VLGLYYLTREAGAWRMARGRVFSSPAEVRARRTTTTRWTCRRRSPARMEQL